MSVYRRKNYAFNERLCAMRDAQTKVTREAERDEAIIVLICLVRPAKKRREKKDV